MTGPETLGAVSAAFAHLRRAGIESLRGGARAGAVGAAGLSALQVTRQPPLPAKPPIGGPVWTIVVPAALLLVSIWGTWLLYRHFAGEK